MYVTSEIKGEVYKNLIEYAYDKCDAVMFVFRRDGFSQEDILKLNNLLNQIKKKFSNSILKMRNGSYWVFSKVGYSQLDIEGYNDPPNYDKLFDIVFLKLNDDIKFYLQSNDNLYKWLNPNFPEDISFFRNGYCWLYSVAHEEKCYIYCSNKKEYDYLKLIGVEFYENKYIPTLKKELYYEEYNLK